jgi:hypothetical protein
VFSIVFACHEAACRPPGSGGTGGSSPAKGSKGALDRVQPILQALTKSGGTPYVVGGFVRDRILGLDSKDLDIEVHGLAADQVARVLRQFGKVDEVGKAFGVLKVKFQGEDLDVSLPRTDSKTGVGHAGFEIAVDPHMGIEAALARRDFTINAIGMDPSGKLVDPYGGEAALKAKVLSAVSPAFAEDPLRVLRGVQFAGRFGMTMDQRTAEMSRSLLSELEGVSLERVWGEFEKIGTKGQDFGAVARVIEQVGLQGRFGQIRPANPDLSGLSGEHRVAVALTALGVDPRAVGATNRVTQRMEELSTLLAFQGSEADSRSLARRVKLSTFADAARIDPALRFAPEIASGPTAPLLTGKDLLAAGMKSGPEMGAVLARITAAQDAGEVTTKEEALRLARTPVTGSGLVASCYLDVLLVVDGS